MGMFDSVFVDCPHCGKKNELQTKNGECILGRYDLVNAPPEVLLGVEGNQTCDTYRNRKWEDGDKGCGGKYTVKVQCITKAWVEKEHEEEW
jgi:hypothetical protein